MASTDPLTPLTQPAWAHNISSLRFPYSIYAYLKKPSADAVTTLGRARQNSGPTTRSRQSPGANTTTNWSWANRQPQIGTSHDSFNRGFVPTPIGSVL
ncbi:hypothetical protein SARC_08825 [Sphaeroforma arctica JP610]|uniref:Uncharacterized protein n=1 Tax=Sphaeroforma arctica JP610 TaxID=667725 RepID=A0A0L0FPW6_9EUKA|nr:hypothetical protein SARC_08825 [Sphaeroforma arctica JP610]KNC78754.1 hypothetical protein SARC_08825 [Sphaeroforma arctica JP610]|eukprot:XP_014152656.1 hypothetical protein SARC_08825 [Sphaeroforma arctica JP610]